MFLMTISGVPVDHINLGAIDQLAGLMTDHPASIHVLLANRVSSMDGPS
jgi:hypothetical protein